MSSKKVFEDSFEFVDQKAIDLEFSGCTVYENRFFQGTVFEFYGLKKEVTVENSPKFVNCTFVGCNFTEGTLPISGFYNCTFVGCRKDDAWSSARSIKGGSVVVEGTILEV